MCSNCILFRKAKHAQQVHQGYHDKTCAVGTSRTIKGGSRRAEKSKKVLMMMKAAKLGWTGAGAGYKQGWTKSRARKGRSRAGQEQGRSGKRARAGRSR